MNEKLSERALTEPEKSAWRIVELFEQFLTRSGETLAENQKQALLRFIEQEVEFALLDTRNSIQELLEKISPRKN